MSRIKEIIIDRENTIRNYIREMDCLTEHMDEDEADEVWDAWIECGLPYDEDDDEVMFDIVTDTDRYYFTIGVMVEFIKHITEEMGI